MHRLFSIPELVEQILLSSNLSRGDRLHFGLTSRTTWDVALPLLWGETTIALPILLNLLPIDLQRETMSDAIMNLGLLQRVLLHNVGLGPFEHPQPLIKAPLRSLTEAEWTALQIYTQEIRTLKLEESGTRGPDLFLTIFDLVSILHLFSSGPSPLFNKLRNLIISGEARRTIMALDSLLGNNVTGLRIDMDSNFTMSRIYAREDLTADDAANRILSAIRLCPSLKLLELSVSGYDLCHALAARLPHALAHMQSLQHISLIFQVYVSGLDILRTIASLPRLQTVTLHTLFVPCFAFPAPPLSEHAWASLQSFVLRLWRSVIEVTVPPGKVAEWISAPAAPGLWFQTEERGDHDLILGRRRNAELAEAHLLS